MAKAKMKKQPSHYPFIPFHIIRIAQLISSLVVSAIQLYFVYHLKHDHYSIPWTFLVILGVALMTLVSQALTIILYCCRSLNPFFNMIVNAGLSLLWATGFGLLTWAMSGTLTHKCDIENWKEDTGVMVCRIYKALFTFVLSGLISTLLALVLDLIVRKRETSRGVYTKAIDGKPADHLPLSQPRDSGGPFDVPRSYGRGGREAGYERPMDQHNYTDTDTKYR